MFWFYNLFRNLGGDAITTVVFWYSLIFCIGRTLMTLFASSTIHDTTRNMLALMRDVPSRSWTLEVI